MLEPGTLVRKDFGKPFHQRSDELVSPAYGIPWIIDEIGLYVLPPLTRVVELRFLKQRTSLLRRAVIGNWFGACARLLDQGSSAESCVLSGIM